MKNKRTVLVIAEIAILSALSLVLDYLAKITTGFLFPFGGSIGIQMIPVVLISYRRGVLSGVATGLIIGLIQFAYGGWYINFFQFLLDYPIPYTVVGLAGLALYLNKKKLNLFTVVLGTVFGGLLKYLSQYLSGVIFWKQMTDYEVFGYEFADNAFNYNTWSLFYNATYSIPSIILSAIVLAIIYVYAKQLFTCNDKPTY